jgi:menaquinone-9 beta-reductase
VRRNGSEHKLQKSGTFKSYCLFENFYIDICTMPNANNVYDVAITGGGLAGLTLAIQCADAGYSVILFEKEQYPFHKVCGEYISMESYQFLERCGVDLQQYRVPHIDILNLTDVGGHSYSFTLPLGGFGISRFTLDNALYQIAISKGVEICANTKVTDITYNNFFTLQTTAGIFTSKVAAGAFGKRSNLDVKWKRNFTTQKPDKLNNYVGVKYHIKYDFPSNTIALHNFKNGYCGISNIEKDTCCLCYLTTADNLKQHNNSIPQMETQLLWQNPALKTIFTNATMLYNEPLAISQISFAKKQQVENHVLMIGDAAGSITPLCGNGMSMAMHAGKLAFEQINNYLKGTITQQNMENNYTANWQQQFSRRLWIGRNVQRLFGNNTSTSVFLSAMHKMPWLASKIISATHGNTY